jgi:hypothetical protein
MKKPVEIVVDYNDPKSLRQAAFHNCIECSNEADTVKAHRLQAIAVGFRSFSRVNVTDQPGTKPDVVSDCLTCINQEPGSRLRHIAADIQGNFPQG